MTEAGDPKNFALTSKRPLPWQSVNRMSVAEALVDLVESDSQNCKAPFIIQT
jgi:hypothetical protein